MSGQVPPSSRAGKRPRINTRDPELRAAARLFEGFTGHRAIPVGSVNVPPLPSVVSIIGHCTAICYRTVRDGVEEDYVHEFAEKDQAMFGVSPNGRQLLLIGGRYVFTDRGIVDLSDTKNLPAKYRALAKRLRR